MRVSITINTYQDLGGQTCTMRTATHMQARDALVETAILLGFEPSKIFKFNTEQPEQKDK